MRSSACNRGVSDDSFTPRELHHFTLKVTWIKLWNITFMPESHQMDFHWQWLFEREDLHPSWSHATSLCHQTTSFVLIDRLQYGGNYILKLTLAFKLVLLSFQLYVHLLTSSVTHPCKEKEEKSVCLPHFCSSVSLSRWTCVLRPTMKPTKNDCSA